MNPQDSLFNWIVQKDVPGTMKPQIPRIIVTPPPVISKSVAQRKKRSRNACLVEPVSAPSKLVLDPNFWTQDKTEAPRAKKQRFLFKCRRADCDEQFSSAMNRNIHERHCLTFIEVLN